jgi:hypothetical protein
MLGKYSKNCKDARTALSIYLDLVRLTNIGLDKIRKDTTRGSSL